MDFADIPITILAGGLGTRLRSVLPTRPKVLALVQGRPFLIYLLDQLAAVGAKEIVFCVGYMADTVEETLGDQYQAIRLTYSREKEPLGTGGALRQALSFFSSDPVLVMNGDSFMDADLAGYLHWFLQKGLEASLLWPRSSIRVVSGRLLWTKTSELCALRRKDPIKGLVGSTPGSISCEKKFSN